MLTEVNAGRMSICDYVRMSAFNPALIWGLYPRKGALSLGAEADIAMVDLAREHTIEDAALQSHSKSRLGTAAASRDCRSTRWCAAAS